MPVPDTHTSATVLVVLILGQQQHGPRVLVVLILGQQQHGPSLYRPRHAGTGQDTTYELCEPGRDTMYELCEPGQDSMYE